MSNVKLTPKWCLDAALLSRPVDLTTLVTLSRNTPAEFIKDNVLKRLITLLLNEKNSTKSDKDTKLDVLNILSNVAMANKACMEEVREALSDISEWFDEYMSAEESDPTKEPELHKSMVLLLARCWEYQLKTEDVLELTQGNRRIALCTVVGLLEDGETYSTTLKQRQKPGQGKMGQWEHELVINRYEKPLLLQVCRLLRGFTHPATYFDANTRENDGEIALYSIERFSEVMDMLLEITIRSRFVEKLSVALYDCFLNEDNDPLSVSVLNSINHFIVDYYHEQRGTKILEESDHLAISCVHAFLQNLYFYASNNTEEFRLHMLMDTLLIPRLMVPYLDKCVTHALILNSKAEYYNDIGENDQISQLVLHNPQLVQGITSSLRTLIIASFRAPNTLYVMILFRKLNPTSLLLRATTFCKYNAYVFTLLCILNINMGTFDLSRDGNILEGMDSASSKSPKGSKNFSNISSEDNRASLKLLTDLEKIFVQMSKDVQQSVLQRVLYSTALPIARDTPSYVTIVSILLGGFAGQFDRSVGSSPRSISPRISAIGGSPPSKYKFLIADANDNPPSILSNSSMNDKDLRESNDEEDEEIMNSRADAKRDSLARMAGIVNNDINSENMNESIDKTSRDAKQVLADAAAIADMSLNLSSNEIANASVSIDEMNSSAFGIAIAVAEAQIQREIECKEQRGSSVPPSPKRNTNNHSNLNNSMKSNLAGQSLSGFEMNQAMSKSTISSTEPSDSNTQPPQSKFRLLGELPSLLTKTSQERMNDIKIAMKLELPIDMKKKQDLFMNPISPKSTSNGLERKESKDISSSTTGGGSHNGIGKYKNYNIATEASSIPKEFLCAINGHVMKEPMVTHEGIYFERETIELWLSTRGSVCPITLKPLTINDLKPAEEIRSRIKRYQIEQTAMRTKQGDYDLYDF